jgi:hypothetical protein
MKYLDTITFKYVKSKLKKTFEASMKTLSDLKTSGINIKIIPNENLGRMTCEVYAVSSEYPNFNLNLLTFIKDFPDMVHDKSLTPSWSNFERLSSLKGMVSDVQPLEEFGNTIKTIFNIDDKYYVFINEEAIKDKKLQEIAKLMLPSLILYNADKEVSIEDYEIEVEDDPLSFSI